MTQKLLRTALLRSAIAGFFYMDVTDTYGAKSKLVKCFEVPGKTEGLDSFPRCSTRSSGKHSGNKLPATLDPITKHSENHDFDVIRGNIYCRIVYDAAKFYPYLKLPSTVFVKLYYYSSRLWEENDLTCLEIPDKTGYYTTSEVFEEMSMESLDTLTKEDFTSERKDITNYTRIYLWDFSLKM